MAGVQFLTGHHHIQTSSVAQPTSCPRVEGRAADQCIKLNLHYPIHLYGMELLNTGTTSFFYLSLMISS
jgi:hypothetical protein